MQIKLTIGQYHALDRIYQSIENHTSISSVTIAKQDDIFAEHAQYVRVEFSSGWGNRMFDIDLAGNSEPVNFGDSAISVEARG